MPSGGWKVLPRAEKREARHDRADDCLSELKDRDIAKRERAMRDKETQLADAKNKLDEQVANQVEEQLKKDRTRIAAEEAKKAKLATATDLEQKTRELADLQEVLKSREEKP